jgi:8-oxo-dGTP diphosphatase
MRHRIAGIVIIDGKLLMLKGKGFAELWTPGGKIEEGESDEECLRREFLEELGVKLLSIKFFVEYTRQSPYNEWMTHQKVYLSSIKGDITPQAEIESYVWLSRKDFDEQKYPMIPVNIELINDLIKEKLF